MNSRRSSACEIPARDPRITHQIRNTAVPWVAVAVSAFIVWSVSVARAATVMVNSTSVAVDFGGARRVADLPGPDGMVTFPEAAIATTNTPGPDLIAFNIPLSDPGLLAGSFRIESEGFVTIGDDYTTVDGTTQTAFTGDTSQGPEIWLFGVIPVSMSSPGLRITSSHNRVTGVGGFNWFQTGIQIEGNDNVVTGCTTVQVLNSGIFVSGAGPNRREHENQQEPSPALFEHRHAERVRSKPHSPA